MDRFTHDVNGDNNILDPSYSNKGTTIKETQDNANNILTQSYITSTLASTVGTHEYDSSTDGYQLLVLQNNYATQSFAQDNGLIYLDNETTLVNTNADELRTLLKNWNVEHIAEHLIAEKVFVNILKIIKRHHIERLLKNFDFATQIIFEHNLEEWRASIGRPFMMETNRVDQNPHIYSSSTSPSSTSRFEMYPSRTPTPSNENSKSIITLGDILDETQKGKNLTKLYDQTSKFNDDQRKSLIKLIAQFFDDKNIPLTLQISYRLEQEIFERFPTEKKEYYRTGKRGKLYNKYINLKSGFRSAVSQFVESKTTAKKEKKSATTRVFEPEEDAENCIRALKFDNLSAEEFDNCWKACSQYRLREIQTLESATAALEKWTQYKLPSGYRMINMDFNSLYNTGNGLLDSWETSINSITKFLSLERHVKDKTILELLEKLKTRSLNENSRDATLLYAIHGYLVPTHKIVKKNDKTGKKDTIKFSIRDSQMAFLYVAKSAADLDNHLMHLKSKRESIQPFVMCIGDNITSITEIFVYFDDIKFKFLNLLRAVDICFKIFYVFNLKFPIEATMFWTFIGTHFYHIKSEGSFPKVHLFSEALKSGTAIEN